MHTLFIDADACPVKAEAAQVAARYRFRVVLVANAPMRAPAGPAVELIVRGGFGAADDYIAEQVGPGDVVVTADIPLAARCLTAGGRVLDPRGRRFTDNDIGTLLALRDLNDTLRQSGQTTPGARPMTPKDRSRFRATLDQLINEVLRANPPRAS